MGDKINIFSELREVGSTILINTENRNYFSVPDNYFDRLAEDMLTQIFIKSLPVVNPYTVPAAYFENLPDAIIEKINIGEHISFQNSEIKTPYAVPDGYFNSLANNILNKIKSSSVATPVQTELEEIAPILSKLPKTNVYTVPENYFDKSDPLSAVNNLQPAARIVSLGSKTRKWLNYAAAACIAAVLFGGGYLYFFNNPKKIISPLAKMDVQKEISVLSDDEITNYLKDNNNIAVYTGLGNDDDQMQNMDIQSLLKNVSDEEIQQYLNDDPESSAKDGGI